MNHRVAPLELVASTDAILRTVAVPVDLEKDDSISSLCQQMLITMLDNNGIGLAAPQVGISKRVITVLDPEEGQFYLLINPMIVKRSEIHSWDEEGCLSFPGEYIGISRPDTVTVIALTPDGTSVTIQAKGILARCLQHEIDHLDGVTFHERKD